MDGTGMPNGEGDQVQAPIAINDQVKTPVVTPGAAEATPEPKADITPSAKVPDDQGAVSRMQQEVAKYKKVMSALNIDPESDFADKFVAGLVGKDDVVRALGVQQPQQPAQVEQPQSAPHQRLAEIINKVKSDGATEEDFTQGLSVVAEVLENMDKQRETTNQQTLMQQCETVVRDVITADELHGTLPKELQDLESELFLASTDYFLASEARKTNNPKAFVNPQGYAFYANKNAERLETYRQHLINYGRSLGPVQQIPTPPKPTTVQPMSPSAGGEPILPTAPVITRDNMRKAAMNYLSQYGVA